MIERIQVSERNASWRKKVNQIIDWFNLARGVDPSSSRSYRVFLSQSGESDPVAVVSANTVAASIVWTRVGVGEYRATSVGAFPANKTFCSSPSFGPAAIVGWEAIGKLARLSNDVIALSVMDTSYAPTDGFTALAIQIQVDP